MQRLTEALLATPGAAVEKVEPGASQLEPPLSGKRKEPDAAEEVDQEALERKRQRPEPAAALEPPVDEPAAVCEPPAPFLDEPAIAAVPEQTAATVLEAPAPAEPPLAEASPRPHALRVDNFVRPFTLPAVRELLRAHGASFDDATDFWMPPIKNCCVVVLASEAEAAAVTAGLQGRVWPAGSLKALAVSSLPVADARRAIAVGSLPVPPPATAAQRAAAAEPLPGGPAGPPGKTLDSLFLKTAAKPQLYYLPLSEEEVAARRGVRS